jgi:hypothetical protein
VNKMVTDRPIWFDGHNAVESAANRQDPERRRQEEASLRQHVAKLAGSAWKARNAVVEPLPTHAPPPIQDAAIFETFERLRLRAESEVTIQGGVDRPRSWAPPLILGGKRGTVCGELGCLTVGDKFVARLWATIARPKRSDRWLRTSSLQLLGGSMRGTVRDMLFEEQHEENGDASARVLDFIGTPDAQMQLAARLRGHCCIRGKVQSDPTSPENCISPERLRRRIDCVNAYHRQEIELRTHCHSPMPSTLVTN